MTYLNTHPESVRKRFWLYTYRRQDHQCWPWIGSVAVRGGYGQLNDRGKLLKAHRLSWELHFGFIPEELFIRHLCHNPVCCNPSHLLPGTAKDNHMDMQKAGRMFVPTSRKGMERRTAKLTDADVIHIRASDEAGATLARRFNVSNSLISSIRKNRLWKHLL